MSIIMSGIVIFVMIIIFISIGSSMLMRIGNVVVRMGVFVVVLVVVGVVVMFFVWVRCDDGGDCVMFGGCLDGVMLWFGYKFKFFVWYFVVVVIIVSLGGLFLKYYLGVLFCM